MHRDAPRCPSLLSLRALHPGRLSGCSRAFAVEGRGCDGCKVGMRGAGLWWRTGSLGGGERDRKVHWEGKMLPLVVGNTGTFPG